MTKNKKDLEALEYFELFWSNVECGITVVDAETREILDINPLAAKMFGADKSEIIGKKCHKFLCPADENACPIMDKHQIVDRSERKFIKANGEIIPIIKSVKKVMLNGRPVLLESFTDISPLKLAEEMIRVLEVNEKSEKAKTEFLTNMSYEMRTPISDIIGMTAAGRSAKDVGQKDQAFEKIGDASAALLGIIDEILDQFPGDAEKRADANEKETAEGSKGEHALLAEEIEKGLKAGMIGHGGEPVDMEKLLEKLRRYR